MLQPPLRRSTIPALLWPPAHRDFQSYHEFTGPEALAYDGPGTDAGNAWKIEKKLSAYDEDSTLSIDLLLSLPTCNGRIGATGMCLGGHLAYRCALDPRISAAVCYFATDIHSHSLGAGKSDDSLQRAGDIKGELVMIFGKKDNHVPPEGRDLIRKTLHDAGICFSFYEAAWAQRELHFRPPSPFLTLLPRTLY